MTYSTDDAAAIHLPVPPDTYLPWFWYIVSTVCEVISLIYTHDIYFPFLSFSFLPLICSLSFFLFSAWTSPIFISTSKSIITKKNPRFRSRFRFRFRFSKRGKYTKNEGLEARIRNSKSDEWYFEVLRGEREGGDEGRNGRRDVMINVSESGRVD